MYTYTAAGVPLIHPPVVTPAEIHHQIYFGHPAYQPHVYVHHHAQPQPHGHYASDVPRYDPHPSIEYNALYESDRAYARAQSGERAGAGHKQQHHRQGGARAVSRPAARHARPAQEGRARLAQEEREHDRGRTAHRHDRRSAVSEASHTATIGTHHHSSRAHQPQPAAHKHHHAPARPSQAHHHSSHHVPTHHQQQQYSDPNMLGVSYVPTAAPSGARTPRAQHAAPDMRERSRSEPRHRVLRPQRSAMKSRSRSRPGASRSRSKSLGRVHWSGHGRDVPVGERQRHRSRGPGISFAWGRR